MDLLTTVICDPIYQALHVGSSMTTENTEPRKYKTESVIQPEGFFAAIAVHPKTTVIANPID